MVCTVEDEAVGDAASSEDTAGTDRELLACLRPRRRDGKGAELIDAAAEVDGASGLDCLRNVEGPEVTI